MQITSLDLNIKASKGELQISFTRCNLDSSSIVWQVDWLLYIALSVGRWQENLVWGQGVDGNVREKIGLM